MDKLLELIDGAIAALEPFAREGSEYEIGDSLTYREGWRDNDELADTPSIIRVGDLWRAAHAQADLRAATDLIRARATQGSAPE
jgi:hypothetical protein